MIMNTISKHYKRNSQAATMILSRLNTNTQTISYQECIYQMIFIMLNHNSNSCLFLSACDNITELCLKKFIYLNANVATIS